MPSRPVTADQQTSHQEEPVPMPTAAPATTPVAARPSRYQRLGVAIVAGAAGFLVWLLAVPVLDVQLVTASADGREFVVGGGIALVVGVVAVLAGWAVLALLERFTARPRRTWTIVALAVLLLSMTGPVFQAQSAASAVTLAVMHLVVGAVAIPLLAATARPSRRVAAER